MYAFSMAKKWGVFPWKIQQEEACPIRKKVYMASHNMAEWRRNDDSKQLQHQNS